MAEVDIYRDTPIRLLGYANEVGEAFRPIVHVNWVRFSYGIASAYVVADTVDKSRIMNEEISSSDKSRGKKILVTAVDTLLWQTFASVIIPGFTINRICALSLYTLKRASSFPPNAQKYITTAIGLGCIPFIFKPIDKLVDFLMDESYRKFVGRNA